MDKRLFWRNFQFSPRNLFVSVKEYFQHIEPFINNEDPYNKESTEILDLLEKKGFKDKNKNYVGFTIFNFIDMAHGLGYY